MNVHLKTINWSNIPVKFPVFPTIPSVFLAKNLKKKMTQDCGKSTCYSYFWYLSTDFSQNIHYSHFFSYVSMYLHSLFINDV